MTHLVSVLMLIGAALYLPWGIFLVAVGLYAFSYHIYIPLLLAFWVDVLFWPPVGGVPWYLLGTAGLLILVEVVRPYVMVQR